MIQVTIAGYTVCMEETIPDRYGRYAESHAALIEEFGLEHEDWSAFYLSVRRGFDWPLLCVSQRYWPGYEWGGWHLGILLVPETDVLFIGAGERVLVYDLRGPSRLWVDTADTGFHRWERYGDAVVLSAELELAVWNVRGTKLWSAPVEPPWEYRVEGGTVHLDVMGATSSFPLLTGPISR